MVKPILILFLITFIFSCKISRNSMREANYQLWLHHEDLELTERISGSASQSKFFGIDWQRTFGKKKFEYGGFGNLPNDPTNANFNGSIGANTFAGENEFSAVNVILNGVIGINSASKVENLAMYDLIRQNPGYDIVMFPSFQTQKKWYVFGSKTDVICTAKLGKLKSTKK